MANCPALSGPSPTLRLSALTLSALIVSAIIGSFIAEIEIVARGTGKIVPIGSVRQVQSQIDGRVTEIAIRDGDSVQQGQLLFALDQTDQKAEAEQVKDRIERLEATAAKFTAELAALDTYDPTDDRFLAFAVDQLQQTDLSGERRLATNRLLVAELGNLSASIAELDTSLASAKADQQVANARLEKNNVLLALEQKLFDAATALQAKAILPKRHKPMRNYGAKKPYKNATTSLNQRECKNLTPHVKLNWLLFDRIGPVPLIQPIGIYRN
jgi:multidrug resistance efflux pump